MVNLAYDQFSRTSTSTWGVAPLGGTYTYVGAGAVFSTDGSIAKVTGVNGVQAYGVLPIGAHSNIEIVGRLRFSTIDGQSWYGFCVRYTDTNNFYQSRISGAGNITISRKVAGTSTDIATFSFTPIALTYYWIRFRAYGSTLQSKYWIDGNPEPSGWTLQIVDAGLATGTAIATRHNADNATFYSNYDDIVVVDYYDGNYNNETFADDGGDNTSEHTDLSSLPMDDSGVLIPEKMDAASMGAFTTLQSESCERKVTDVTPLVDAGSVTQTIPIVTESIGLNYEMLKDTLTVSGEKKDTSAAFAFQSQMRSTENIDVLSSPLTDVPATSVFHTDTTLEAFMDNTPTKVGTSAQFPEVLPLSDSMTHEIDIYKNLTEVLTEVLIPPLEEDKTIDSLLLVESAGIHTLYYTVVSSDVMVAIDGTAANSVYESIVIESAPLDATERVSGDNTNAPVTLLLVDILRGGVGNYQLQDNLAAAVFPSLTKETQQVQTLLSNVSFTLEKNFLENLITYLLDDVIHMISVQSGDNSLSISDISVTSSEKIFYESNPVTETNSRTEEERSITIEGFALTIQNARSQGATVGSPENLKDASSYSTGLRTDMTSNQFSYQQSQQRETVALLTGMVQDILHILGEETSIYTVLLDSTGNAIGDVPDALKRYVVWKTPAMQAAWSTPLTTLVVRTPAMQAVWKTPTMVVKWELVE